MWFLSRYAGRFCIRCLISFIFGFLGSLYPKVKWVLISKFFQNLEFLPRFACRPIFSGFLGMSWVVDLEYPFGYQPNLIFIFMLSWDACCIHPCVLIQSLCYDLLSEDLRVSTFRGIFGSYDHWGWVGNLHAYGHSSLDEHG